MRIWKPRPALSIVLTPVTLLLGGLLLSACATQSETVSGSVSYDDRSTLPPDAVFEVRIEDTSLADVAAKTLVSKQISSPQDRLRFKLKVPLESVDPQHSYSVSARIVSGDRLLFTTDSHYPVLTRGHDNEVALELTAVNHQQQPQLRGTRWQLQRLGGLTLEADGERIPYLQLDSDEQRAAGHSGCNAFGGDVVIDGQRLTLGPLMSTRMMCSDKPMALEDRMQDALSRVAGWRIDGQFLQLMDDQDQELMRFVAADDAS